MEKLIMCTFDIATGETTSREMTSEEIAQHLATFPEKGENPNVVA